MSKSKFGLDVWDAQQAVEFAILSARDAVAEGAIEAYADNVGSTLTEHDAGVYHGPAMDAFRGEVARLLLLAGSR